MYHITEEQTSNFWNYCCVSYPFELGFFMKITEIFAENYRELYNDKIAIKQAECLAEIINEINPPEDGQYNKAVVIMGMARAYVKFLDYVCKNDRFNNAGSFHLICLRISNKVY